MNKSELIDVIAQQAQLTKADSARALDGLLNTIQTTLKAGDSVTLAGFGSFEVKARAERTGRNPQNGTPITIAAANIPGFKPGKNLKDAVNS
jgi:DNA-binding protein HU-beta